MNRIENKIVIVTRPTRLKALKAKFSTLGQAKFYVEHMGSDFSDYQKEDEGYQSSLRQASELVAPFGRIQVLERNLLPNYVFGPEDIVITLGQDGLVANTLKYLDAQPVIGVNPDPKRWDGKLLRFKVTDLPKIIPEVQTRRRPTWSVTMAKATFNNKSTLYAVNDLFIGHRSHGSALYVIEHAGRKERQSSSGVVVSTGLGSSGWLKSLLTGANAIARAAGEDLNKSLPMDEPPPLVPETTARRPVQTGARTEIPWDSRHLFFTVREPFPTRTTGATMVFGRVKPEQPLTITSQMSENGVVFSDGIEHDFLQFNSGTTVTIGLAEKQGKLVV